MRITQSVILAFFLLFLSVATGCSSKPTEADVRGLIVQKISQNSNGLIKLVGFRKTNGIEHEFGGTKVYEMEWVAELEFVADCVWDKSTFEAIPPPQGLDAFLHLTKQKKAKGARVDLSGSTTLQKTENGWR